MRLRLDAGRVVFLVDASDTVDSVARLVDLLSGPQGTQWVTDDGMAYTIHIQPGNEDLPFVIVLPQGKDTDNILLELCAAYLAQQDSPA